MLKILELKQDSDSFSLIQRINHQSKMKNYSPQSNSHSGKNTFGQPHK